MVAVTNSFITLRRWILLIVPNKQYSGQYYNIGDVWIEVYSVAPSRQMQYNANRRNSYDRSDSADFSAIDALVFK